MYVDDDIFDRIDADYVILQIDGILIPFFLEEYRFKTDETALVKFEGIDTQEQARSLTGTNVYFLRRLAEEELASEDEYEYGPTISYAQLVGYTVLNANDNNRAVGEIAYIDTQTVNILFELTDGTLIPASEELILYIDTKSRTVIMSLPEGLL